MKGLIQAGVFVALLSITGCRTAPSTPPTESRAGDVQVATPSATPASPLQYESFIHVSELYREGLSERSGRALSIAGTATQGTLISLDQNESPDEIKVLLKALGDKPVDFCLYVDGPGGPTGEKGEYDPDELMRIVERARHYVKSPITDPRNRFLRADGRPSPHMEDYEGYTTSQLDHLPWMKEWNSTGWPLFFKDQTLPQLRGQSPFTDDIVLHFKAVEIDNLYRHLSAKGHTFGQFLEEYASWVRESSPHRLSASAKSEFDMRLILKNLNYDDDTLKMVEGALAFGQLHGPEIFAGVHVAEADRDDFPGRTELDALLSQIGVVTVVSLDTNDYVATTFPKHRQELNDRQALTRLEKEAAILATPSEQPDPES